MTGFLAPIDAIPAQPQRHGLQQSIPQVLNGPDKWELGMSAPPPENCVQVSTWDPDCAAWPLDGGGDVVKPEKDSDLQSRAGHDLQPFVIYTQFECDAQQLRTIDFKGRCTRQLEAASGKGLEYELWTGAQSGSTGNPYLMSDNATVIGGGAAFGARQAWTLLAQSLANCGGGGVGVIHATTFIVEEWLYASGGSAIREENGRLVSVGRGDTVVSGAGYTGEGPDGETAPGPHQAWAYATGPMRFWMGDPILSADTVAEAMDRKRNNVEYRAERFAVVDFDTCCHFAILIDPSI